MQSFGTWEPGPSLAPPGVTRAGRGKFNKRRQDRVSYVELGRFCKRDLPRSPSLPGDVDTDVTMSWLLTSGLGGALDRQIMVWRRSE